MLIKTQKYKNKGNKGKNRAFLSGISGGMFW